MKKGDIVICIDDTIKPEFLFDTLKFYPQWILEDNEYRIRHVFYNDDIVAGILLEEVTNPEIFIKLINKKQEPAFATWRFRLHETLEESMEESVSEDIEQELLQELKESILN